MAREPKKPLTQREEEVLALLRRGLTNAQLASELGISENTAKDHVSSILYKLDTKTRDEAAYWPDKAPWWARAPLIAPLALLLRRSAARLPFSPSMATSALAGIALIAVIAGLSLLAFLLLRTDGSEGSSTPLVVDDLDKLEPGITFHLIDEGYRRYGPAAAVYSEHFPENGPEKKIGETWIEFDEDGAMHDFRFESRGKDGTILSSQWLDGGEVITEDATAEDTVATGPRTIGEQIVRARLPGLTAKAYIRALRRAYEELELELEEHQDAPVVHIGGTEYVLIEERSPTGRGGPASPSSFSSPYVYDLDPIERIRRDYYPLDGTFLSRSEIWVVDAQGVETLVEYTYHLVHEVLAN